MTKRSYLRPTLLAAVMAIAGAGAALAEDPGQQHGQPQPKGPEAAYLAENNAAMDRMMTDMAVKPSGDVDRDFVAMMTPHHQGAIEMAMAVLKYGKNEQLKRIAQEIIVDQQQEIAAMKLAIGDPLPPSNAAPTQVTPDSTPAPATALTPTPLSGSSSAMQGMAPDMKM
jgi:uncharacterized protein (DUF305 family)